MDNWFCCDTDGVRYFQIPSFQKTGLVQTAFTTRWGGGSRDEYADFNQGLHVGDDSDVVVANRARLADRLGFSLDDLVVGEQIHGRRVEVVTAADRVRGARDLETAVAGTDGLVTNEPGVAIATQHADCAAIFLLDPVRRAIGLAHAGWKGTALEIGQAALQVMGGQFGTRPADCLAGISPAIGPCCYEVDARVRDQLPLEFLNWPGVLINQGDGRYRLNLWEANKRSLMAAGVPESSISISCQCTNCHPELFYSYRYAGGRTGRMTAVLMLNI